MRKKYWTESVWEERKKKMAQGCWMNVGSTKDFNGGWRHR